MAATAAAVSPSNTAASDAPGACVGNYVAPKIIKPGVTAVAVPDADGYAKHKTYQVIADTNGLQVIRVKDSQPVLMLSQLPSAWAFSPDEQRFVTVSTQAMALYGLSNNGALLHAQDENWGFSPHGKYLSSFSLSNQVPTVQVFDAHTGDVIDLGGSNLLTGYTNIGFSSNDDSLLL